MNEEELIEAIAALLESSQVLAPLGQALRESQRPEELTGMMASLAGSQLSPQDQEVVEKVGQLVFRHMATLIGEIAADVGLNDVEFASGAHDQSAAPVDTAVTLMACVELARQMTGGADDYDRVVAMLNLGFGDSLANVEPEMCIRGEDSVDRQWAVVSTANDLADATEKAVEALLSSARGGAAITNAELSAMVDSKMVTLLTYFPKVVDEFSAKLTEGFDDFLESF